MKILITGKNSYIGTSFETWLKQYGDKYQVQSIDVKGEVVIYEPVLKEEEFFHSTVIKNLEEINESCCVIVLNRVSHELKDVEEKVLYKRFIY